MAEQATRIILGSLPLQQLGSGVASSKSSHPTKLPGHIPRPTQSSALLEPPNLNNPARCRKARDSTGKVTLRFLQDTTSITDRLSGWQGPPPSVDKREEEMRKEADRLVTSFQLAHTNLRANECNPQLLLEGRFVLLYRPNTPTETSNAEDKTTPHTQYNYVESSSASRLAQLFGSTEDSLIKGIVRHVITQLRYRFALVQHQVTDGVSPIDIIASPGGGISQSSGSQKSGRTNGLKRLYQPSKGKAEDGGSDDNDDDEERQSRSKLRRLNGKEKETLHYACPYFKYNPTKYKSWKGCPGPGWPSVHRVKEHLYRRHKPPKHRCGRCGEGFKDEKDHLDHQRRIEPCTLCPEQPIEGFDADQEVLLRSRKKAVTELCEMEKWKAVFRILFPHVQDDDIPSPFYDVGECEQYTLREFPALLRQALKLNPDYCDEEEGLKTEEIDETIRNVLGQVFLNFRNLNKQEQASKPLPLSRSSTGAGPSNLSHPHALEPDNAPELDNAPEIDNAPELDNAPEPENESRTDGTLQDTAPATEGAPEYGTEPTDINFYFGDYMADMQFAVDLFGGLSDGLTIEQLLGATEEDGSRAGGKKPSNSGYASNPNTFS